jgi:hypothetical protein
MFVVTYLIKTCERESENTGAKAAHNRLQRKEKIIEIRLDAILEKSVWKFLP